MDRYRPIDYVPPEDTCPFWLGGNPPVTAQAQFDNGTNSRFFVCLPAPVSSSERLSVFLHFDMNQSFELSETWQQSGAVIEALIHQPGRRTSDSSWVSELSPAGVTLGRWIDDVADDPAFVAKLHGEPALESSILGRIPRKLGLRHYFQLPFRAGPADYVFSGTWPFNGGQLNGFYAGEGENPSDWWFVWTHS